MSEEICTIINTAVDSALKIMLKDISIKYKIDIGDLEADVLNKKKKQNEYTKYNSKRRKELLEENPKYKFGEMSKIISLEWGKMTKEEEKKESGGK